MKVNKNKMFTVKSVYDAMLSNDSGTNHKLIWKGKIPAKIKIFLWLMKNNVVLTKDNLIRRQWSGDPKCCFRELNETMDHLFFTFIISKIVWAVVAKVIGVSDIPTNMT